MAKDYKLDDLEKDIGNMMDSLKEIIVKNPAGKTFLAIEKEKNIQEFWLDFVKKFPYDTIRFKNKRLIEFLIPENKFNNFLKKYKLKR